MDVKDKINHKPKLTSINMIKFVLLSWIPVKLHLTINNGVVWDITYRGPCKSHSVALSP